MRTLLEKEKTILITVIAYAFYTCARSMENIAIKDAIIPCWQGLIDSFQGIALIAFFTVFLCIVRKSSKKKRIIIAIIGILIVMTALVSHAYQMLWLYLFVLDAEDLDIVVLAKISLTVAICTIGLGGLFQLLGLTWESSWFSGQGRFSLGLIHPNVLGKEIMCLCLSWITLRFKSGGLFDVFGITALAMIMYSLCGSRTTLIGIVAAMFLWFIGRYSLARGEKATALLKKCASILVPLICCTWVVLMYIYDKDNPILSVLNSALTGRISFPSELLASAPLTLFGFDLSLSAQYVSANSISALQGTIPIDNAYCHLFIVFGPLTFILFVVLSVLAIIKCSEENFTELIGYLACLVIGVTEVYILDIGFNYFVKILASPVHGKEKNKILEDHESMRLGERSANG